MTGIGARTGFLQPRTHVVAVHARHLDVEQDEIGARIGAREIERLLSVGGELHFVTRLERRREQVADVFVVVDDEDQGAVIPGHGRASRRAGEGVKETGGPADYTGRSRGLL